jgi:type III pantothenate kinase
MSSSRLLAVDVGNTHTVLGVFDGELLTDSWRVKTDARATADELALQMRGLLGETRPTGIALCSTVPAVLHEMRLMCARYYAAVATVVVEPGVRTGVPLLYDHPREVGPDRIVNSLAAYHLYGGPAVVVDFGTSTNFDVVSARGEFLGGVLAPGVEISLDALAARGARLFKVEIGRPRSVIGKNTVEALQSGVLYGTVGQVDGLVRRICDELGADAVVVATGGLAPLVLQDSETITHHVPDLTLIGLRLVFDKNVTP